MKWKLFFIALLFASAVTSAYSRQHPISIEEAAKATLPSQCVFTPPQGWEIADPKSLSPRVKIAFLKNTGKGFCPSINLAIEQTQVSLSSYLKAVKAIHEQDRNNHWRTLGKVKTSAGLAQLTEIDSTTEWGPIRILQLILIKEGNAYVLTAAALREEFSDFYKEIQTSFRSLSLTTDLFSTIPQLERRETLKNKEQLLLQAAKESLTSSTKSNNLFEDPLFQKNHWIPFKETILSNFTDMGAFWQVLILRDIQEKLTASAVSDQRPPEPSIQ